VAMGTAPAIWNVVSPDSEKRTCGSRPSLGSLRAEPDLNVTDVGRSRSWGLSSRSFRGTRLLASQSDADGFGGTCACERPAMRPPACVQQLKLRVRECKTRSHISLAGVVLYCLTGDVQVVVEERSVLAGPRRVLSSDGGGDRPLRRSNPRNPRRRSPLPAAVLGHSKRICEKYVMFALEVPRLTGGSGAG
jgi:hypothetical protein